MTGHRKFSDIRRGPPGSWSPVAGDDRWLHHFTDVERPDWWRAADCGAGPAVGMSESDARLGTCTVCLPVTEVDVDA